MCFRPPEAGKGLQKCPACGKFSKPGSTVCHKCGTDLSLVVCPHCGELQNNTLLICPNCGFNGKPDSGDPAKKKA